MLRSCPGCGQSVDPRVLVQNRCPRCLRQDPRRMARAVTGSWSPGRDQKAHAEMRRAVRRRAGGRCEHLENGQRCAVTYGLQLHHDREGYEPEDGRMLCRTHHQNAHPTHGIG